MLPEQLTVVSLVMVLLKQGMTVVPLVITSHPVSHPGTIVIILSHPDSIIVIVSHPGAIVIIVSHPDPAETRIISQFLLISNPLFVNI
jgi:hypothetical protein